VPIETSPRENKEVAAVADQLPLSNKPSAAELRSRQFGGIAIAQSLPVNVLANNEKIAHQFTASPKDNTPLTIGNNQDRSTLRESPQMASNHELRARQFALPAGGKSSRMAFNLRASSVPVFLDCPARWEAIHLHGMRTSSTVQSKFGTSLHSGVAAFDRRRMIETDGIAEEANAAFVDELAKPEDGVKWETGEYEKAQKIGLELLKKYFSDIAPLRKFVAVETRCPDYELDIEGVVLRLTGTLDRIRQDVEGRMGISDFKSGETAVRADGTVVVSPHRSQLGMYEILGSKVTGFHMSLPSEIIGLQTNGKARVGIGEMHNAAESLIGTEEAPGTLVFIARMLKNGIFFGNPKSLMCSNKFCPVHKTCKFRA
jgi:hypothetical protein